MKICAIGNSQLAAFKTGWELVAADNPGVSVIFFAAKTKLWRWIEVKDESILSTSPELSRMLSLTSGGMDRIAADYDRYLMVGMELSPRVAIGLTSDAMVAEHLLQTQAFRVRKFLRKITSAPLAVVSAPYHSDRCGLAGYEEAISVDEADATMKRYEAALHMLAEEHRFQYFPQPRQTLAAAMLTQAVFGTASPNIRGDGVKTGQRHDDTHMNAAFGAVCWREILSNSEFLDTHGG